MCERRIFSGEESDLTDSGPKKKKKKGSPTSSVKVNLTTAWSSPSHRGSPELQPSSAPLIRSGIPLEVGIFQIFQDSQTTKTGERLCGDSEARGAARALSCCC